MIQMQHDHGLYIISVAARLLEMHPQTLRKYERVGFITPSRTVGMLRLYSSEDIEKLRLIKYLVEERGLNLAGIELVLEILPELVKLGQLADSPKNEKDLKEEVQARIKRVFDSLNLELT